ncbi:MAG: hypothetical protein GY715_04455 [Planctomycetes bacterium]|nr:hypothetical protein [Planctomycetota bacterium]
MNQYEPDACASDASPRSSLPRMLAPLRVERTVSNDICTIVVEPMHATEALEVLGELRGEPGSEILLTGPGSDPATAEAIASLARRLELPDDAVQDEAHLVVGGRRCEDLGGMRVPDDLEATLVEGPIEPGDARAIAEARAHGASALTADLRATAAVRVACDRTLTIETRLEDDALLFVAERLRCYAAALRGQSVQSIERPDPALIGRILERTGYFQIRPIETEVYSTAIDIGIVTSSVALGPADTALIYDLYANSWHGD